MTLATRRAVLADVELPAFGMPATEPLLPVSIYAERLERLRTRMEQRRYDHLVVWADREHSANLAYLTGFDPRFEEAVLVVSPGGDPALLVGNENLATADAAPLPLRCVRFQDLSLPGQPRDGSLPLPEILAAEGIGVWEQRGCRRLEDVRRPGHDGSAIVPRRRAAPDDGPDGCRRERH